MEQLRHLGFFGIFRETFKTIFQLKKTFFFVTLTLLFPLSAINLAQSLASELMFTKIIRNPNLGGYEDDGEWGALQVGARYGFVSLWLFKVIYYGIYLFLSLIPTAAIITAIFDREVTFKNTITVMPRFTSRLVATFLWSLATYVIYNAIFFGMFFVWFKYIWINSTAGVVLIVVFLVLYIVILCYMLMIWQVANSVSLVEGISGRAALRKGEDLMKGKKVAYSGCFVVILALLAGVHFVFEFFVVMNVTSEGLGTGVKVAIGVACVVVVSLLELLRIVNQTVVYLVCKSVHREEDMELLPCTLPTKRPVYV